MVSVRVFMGDSLALTVRRVLTVAGRVNRAVALAREGVGASVAEALSVGAQDGVAEGVAGKVR